MNLHVTHPSVLCRFIVLTALAVGGGTVAAQPLKVPVDSDDKGTVYVSPNAVSTDDSVRAHGAAVGVVKPDGSEKRVGVDTSTPRPTYSVGGATGGNTSLSVDLLSDGKANAGAKAGVTIKY